jgi:hypothetical protein
VHPVGPGEAITTVDDARLLALPASAAGRVAIENLLSDQRLLREHNLDPALNCIHGYPRDETVGPVATDVFSYHADSATVESDTWLTPRSLMACDYDWCQREPLAQDPDLRPRSPGGYPVKS